MTDDMTTSHVYGCEHPGCHKVGSLHVVQHPFWRGVIHRYLCAAHADEKEPADG